LDYQNGNYLGLCYYYVVVCVELNAVSNKPVREFALGYFLNSLCCCLCTDDALKMISGHDLGKIK